MILDLSLSSGKCIFGLASSGSDVRWLMGDVFLRNYYSLWDDENSKFSIAPHPNSVATITTGTKPTLYLKAPTISFWDVLFIVL